MRHLELAVQHAAQVKVRHALAAMSEARWGGLALVTVRVGLRLGLGLGLGFVVGVRGRGSVTFDRAEERSPPLQYSMTRP